MGKRITIIDGHPDPGEGRFCHALAGAYASASVTAGHDARRVVVGEIGIPFLRTRAEWESGAAPEVLHFARDAVDWADHLVIIYPLWLGSMPAMLKAFLEQVFRAGIEKSAENSSIWPCHMKGKSARIVVSMGMPALTYRCYVFAHSLKSLERSILRFSGIGPVRETLIGNIEAIGEAGRKKWLARINDLGRRGE